MDTHTTKSKNLTSESSSQPQDSKRSSSNKTTAKVMSSRTTRVHKVHKNTKSTTTAIAQADKKPKQKLKQKAPSKKDIVKAKAAKKEAGTTTTATTKPKSKSKGSPSASVPASASASTSNLAKRKNKASTTSTKKAEGIKSQKRTASEVDDTDVVNESEAEGQLGRHRPTKTRRIQKDKAEETDARSTLKRKKAARNDAIWKMITGGSVASSDSSTTTTITSNKEIETMGKSTITAIIGNTVTTATIASVMEVAPAVATPAVTAVRGVGFRVVDEVQDAVDQLSIHEGDSENKTGDITDMNASGDQSSDAPAAAAAASTSSRRQTLDVLDDAALENVWAIARGKLD